MKLLLKNLYFINIKLKVNRDLIIKIKLILILIILKKMLIMK